MAIVITIDQITVLEAEERHGALRRLVREALVSGLDTSTWDILTSALDDSSLPQYGDYLTTSAANNAYELRLIARYVTVVDQTHARVRLTYENIIDTETDLDDPRNGLINGELRINLQQKTSNLDADGNQIILSHTWPDADPDYSNETEEQGGEIQYYEPQKTIHITGIKKTRKPWLTANSIVAHVNSEPFSGGEARTWLCTGCTWKLSWHGRSPDYENRYLMNFEFQNDLDTWDPTATFVDGRTNRHPPDLVAGTGYKTIEKMEETDFNTFFEAPIQGG